MDSWRPCDHVVFGMSGFSATQVRFLKLSSIRRGSTRTELVELPFASLPSRNANGARRELFQPASSQRSNGAGRPPVTRQRNSTEVSALRVAVPASIETVNGDTAKQQRHRTIYKTYSISAYSITTPIQIDWNDQHHHYNSYHFFYIKPFFIQIRSRTTETDLFGCFNIWGVCIKTLSASQVNVWRRSRLRTGPNRRMLKAPSSPPAGNVPLIEYFSEEIVWPFFFQRIVGVGLPANRLEIVQCYFGMFFGVYREKVGFKMLTLFNGADESEVCAFNERSNLVSDNNSLYRTDHWNGRWNCEIELALNW